MDLCLCTSRWKTTPWTDKQRKWRNNDLPFLKNPLTEALPFSLNLLSMRQQLELPGVNVCNFMNVQQSATTQNPSQHEHLKRKKKTLSVA